MTVINLEQNTQEWLDFRKDKIGASDAPVIMDLSPWMSPLELYNEKVLGKSRPSNWAMERGKELEPKAREMLEKTLLMKFTPQVMVDKEYPWMIASLDGVSEDGKTAVEIKCPTSLASHMKAISGEIPENYRCQMQHQMRVSGLDKMVYCSYFNDECEVIEVARDTRFIKMMIEKEKEFLQCMINKTPPEGNAKEDAILENSDDFIKISEEYKEMDTAIKLLTEQKNIARERLIEIANDRTIKGNGIVVSKRVTEGRVNHKAMPLSLLEEMEKYRGEPTTSWVVRIS